MIKLNYDITYRGEKYRDGARVSLPSNIEERLIENGIAIRDEEEHTQSDPQATDLTCPICGKVCKNELGFQKHVASCKKKADENV